MAPVSLPTSHMFALWVSAQIVVKKIQGRRADDFDRARDQDPGLQRQVEVTALQKRDRPGSNK